MGEKSERKKSINGECGFSCFMTLQSEHLTRQRHSSLCSVWQIIGLICILATTTCSLLLALPYSRWCMRRNYFQALLEEAILEKTENILMTEMGKAAADSVTKSLLVLSSTVPAKIKTAQKKAENENREEMLLNVNANWKKVAYIAGSVIESIPNNVAHNNNNGHLHRH